MVYPPYYGFGFAANSLFRGNSGEIVLIRPCWRPGCESLAPRLDLSLRYVTMSWAENVPFGGMVGFLLILPPYAVDLLLILQPLSPL